MASKEPLSSSPSPGSPAYREIRADYTDTTITVYQAYHANIAIPAVTHQSLTASPNFSLTRMTWIKPSWAWMLYRSGYSYKDERQSHILAIKLKHETFFSLLRQAVLSNATTNREESVGKKMEKGSVIVQWDPERSIRIGKLGYRSIQIGIRKELVEEYCKGIVGIEDVTEKARTLKRVLDEEDGVGVEELRERGLVPLERVFEVPEDVRKILKMDRESYGTSEAEKEE